MKDRGNVLFIVFMTLGLLAALTYTVTRSAETVTGANRDAEEARLAASEIIKHAGHISDAFERVRFVNGCEMREVLFDHADRANYNTAGYYVNANARPDGSCDVFSTSGGHAVYQTPPSDAVAAGGTEYNVQNNLEVAGFGAGVNQSDLLLVTFVTEDICYQINSILGIDNPSGAPPDYSAAGSFSVPGTTAETFPDFSTNSHGFNTPVMEIGGSGAGEAAELANHPSGCFLASASLNEYVFYSLLAAR